LGTAPSAVDEAGVARFVCGDPVLDLVGQDVVLDTFYLRSQPSPADAEVLHAKAYGDVHLRCFVGSRWAPF
jgi:hypothetical protein